jgi:hypothetical protein
VLAALASQALHVADQPPPPALGPFLNEVRDLFAPANPQASARRTGSASAWFAGHRGESMGLQACLKIVVSPVRVSASDEAPANR